MFGKLRCLCLLVRIFFLANCFSSIAWTFFSRKTFPLPPSHATQPTHPQTQMDKFGGIPSMYVPLTEFENMKAAGKEAGEQDNLEQIVKRVQAYRPEKEFVVVFQAVGVMG